MTLAASIALLSAGIALYVAILARQFSRAPGWQDQRYFALAAVAVSGFAILNIPTTAPFLSDEAVFLCSRIQFSLAALHSAAWLRYSTVVVGRPGSRTDRRLLPILAVLAAVGTLTPAFVTPEIFRHAFPPLGVVYRSAKMTLAGDLGYALVLGLLLVPITRFARAWRRGVANAGVQFAALVGLLVLSINDTLVLSRVYSAPYLVDVAFLLPIAAVGYALTSRFVEDARAHQALRDGLERQVADRTAELGRAQEALHRAEKLAALGQFAAGVAHEVNNPAAVLAANLQYVQEQEGADLTPNARNAIDESLLAVQRIAIIVRQLLDAGRLAATPEPRSSVALRRIADGALSVARARFGRRARLTNLAAEGVNVSAQEGVLTQVLVNLVVNAVQAVPEDRADGEVTVRADRVGELVRVVVEDNGEGMDAEVLRHAFEPFFTTKPFGSGTGLGLAVSRGLVASLGGDLRLESEPGKGTRAIVELVRAELPTVRGVAAEDAAGPDPERLRLLIVDDEAGVLSSLERLLENRYRVRVASGIVDGLARIQAETFDVVLCDLMMPAGGGERLYKSLLSRAPAMARRVVFFTGGAVTEAARAFLLQQPQPVLFKPLDLDQLARVAERLGAAEPPLAVRDAAPPETSFS
jgi:signal transduction histidine kinase/CheY-like chemotaxis protein